MLEERRELSSSSAFSLDETFTLSRRYASYALDAISTQLSDARSRLLNNPTQLSLVLSQARQQRSTFTSTLAHKSCFSIDPAERLIVVVVVAEDASRREWDWVKFVR